MFNRVAVSETVISILKREVVAVEKQTKFTAHKAVTLLGTVLCIILLPILVINLTLIVKSYVNKVEVPSIGGYLPIIVLTDSMYPEIKSGDLIICKTADANTVKENDVISFFDPA